MRLAFSQIDQKFADASFTRHCRQCLFKGENPSGHKVLGYREIDIMAVM